MYGKIFDGICYSETFFGREVRNLSVREPAGMESSKDREPAGMESS